MKELVKITTLLISLYLFVFSIKIYGQELPNQLLPSPIAMQFQKYGDYPVSHYTGIPDIKIPIYTIKQGDIEVPIYISFHASGLNLNEERGILGYGWTLHTGGTVSRTINGPPDEYPYHLEIPDLDVLFPFSSSYPYPYSGSHWYMNYITNDVNHEYDIYHYSFPGHSGKFLAVFTENDTPNSGYRFKFKADNVSIHPSSRGYYAIDDRGVIYSFGGEGKEELQQYTVPRGLGTSSTVSAWHLSSIGAFRHPGSVVSYLYQDGPLIEINKPYGIWKLDDYFNVGRAIHETVKDFEERLRTAFPHNFFTGDHYQTSPYMRNYFCRVPQRVSFSEGYLLFHLDSEKYLNKIELFNNKNELIRTVDFLLYNFSGSSKYKKLESVTFKDADGGNVETYSFEYYNENGGVGNHGGRDHWGFYNGFYLSSEYHLTVSHNYPYQFFASDPYVGTINFGQTGNEREPNEESAKTYMLEKITYPTGGYTKFDYEGNRLGDDFPENTLPLRLVGGLRIKQISSYTNTGELLLASSKTYNYKSQWYTESDVDVNTKNFYVEHSIIESYPDQARRSTIYQNIPLNLFPKGAPIGYYEVTETEGEVVTTYTFDDEDAYVYEAVSTPGVYSHGPNEFNFRKMAHHYRPWAFGNLVTKSTVAPGYYRLESYVYKDSTLSTLNDLNIYQNVLNLKGGPSSIHTSTSDFNFKKRYYHSGFKRLESKYVTERGSDGQRVSFTERYGYNNIGYPLQVSSKQVADSKGEIIKTDYVYANNLAGSVYEHMVEQNIISEVLEETVTNLSHSKELSKTKKEYSLFQPNPANLPIVQLQNIQSSIGGEVLETDIMVDRYDSKGRILQHTGKDGLITSYIYGYGELYPVAKIVGADYDSSIALVNQNMLNNLASSEIDILNHLSALRLALPWAQVTTYTYAQGVGMTSQTDPRGQTIYYEYDSYQRLKGVKDNVGSLQKGYRYHYKP